MLIYDRKLIKGSPFFLFFFIFYFFLIKPMDPNYPYYPSHTDHERTVSENKRSTLLLATEPKDLDKLFDRSIEVEQDICFPTKRPASRSVSSDSTTAAITPPAQRKQSNNSINVNALSSWFSDIDMYTTTTQNYRHPTKTKQVKKLSLYGDNHHHSMSENGKEDRYMYYHPDTGVIRGRSLMELRLPSHMTVDELLVKENYWIDFTSPSLAEMKAISKVCNSNINLFPSLFIIQALDFSYPPIDYGGYHGPRNT